MLTELHRHVDGEPCSLDGSKAIIIEAHTSGVGTRVVLAYEQGSSEHHVAEEYAFVLQRLTEGVSARILRRTKERIAAGEDPFGSDGGNREPMF